MISKGCRNPVGLFTIESSVVLVILKIIKHNSSLGEGEILLEV